MTPELRESFLNTRYALQLPTGGVNLAVDQHCPQLNELLRTAGCDSAVWLTAFNPGSRLHTDAQNHAAQAILEARLLRGGYTLFPGIAVDPAGEWPPEPSLLAPGVPITDAMRIARDFGQLAFLWFGADAVPRLVETRLTEADQGSR